MILRYAHLRNFRQHEDLRVPFGDGLTAIAGLNGRGKSTVFEAVEFALFGAAASRTTTAELVRHGAAPSDLNVEVGFELDGHEFRVARTLGAAAVFCDEGPVANGATAAAKYLSKQLGLGREDFRNTYLAAQKDLEFMRGKGGADRGRFVSRVLGYDVIRKAAEICGDARKAAKARLGLLLAQLEGKPAVDPSAEASAEEAVTAATYEVETQAESAAEAAEFHRALADRITVTRGLSEQDAALAQLIQGWEATRTSLAEQLGRAGAQSQRLDSVARSLREEKDRLGSLDLQQRRDELVALQRSQDGVRERTRLAAEQADVADQVAMLDGEVAGLREAAQKVPTLEAEIIDLRDRARVAAEVLEIDLERLREEGSAATREATTAAEGAAALLAEVAELDRLGASADCPKCNRPLEAVFGAVRAAAVERAAELEKAAAAASTRRAALREQYRAAQETLQAQGDNASAELAKLHQALAAAMAAADGLAARRARLGQLTERAATLTSTIAELPDTVDEARIAVLEQVIRDGDAVRTRVASLEAEAADLVDAVREHQRLQGEAAVADEQLEGLRRRRAALGFDPAAHSQLQVDTASAAETAHAHALALEQAKGRRAEAESALAAIRAAAADRAQLEGQAAAAKAEVRLLEETDRVYGEVRKELNDSIRPELSAIATEIVADITAGRITEVQVEEDYSLSMYRDGRRMPVASGGEQDVANLAYRLALSEMIARRSGRPLRFLMLDEVFGSLDSDRMRRTVEALTVLASGRVPQILAITHSDPVRDAADRVLVIGDEALVAEGELQEVAA